MKKNVFIYLMVVISTSCSQENKFNTVQDDSVNKKCNVLNYKSFKVYEIRDLFECGFEKKALEVIELNKNNYNVDEKVSVGSILFDYGYYDKAEFFLKMAKKNGNAEANYRLGYIYTHVVSKKNINEAIILFNNAINGGYDDALVNLGEIYLFENNYKNLNLSKFFFQQAIDRNINIANYGLGYYYLKIGNYKMAENCFDNLIKSNYFDLAYLGNFDMYYDYQDFDGHDVVKAKRFLDLALGVSEDYQVFEKASEFYSGDHEFKNIEKSLYYKKIADANNPFLH